MGFWIFWISYLARESNTLGVAAPTEISDRLVRSWLMELFSEHKLVFFLCLFCLLLLGLSEPVLPWAIGGLIDGAANQDDFVLPTDWLPVFLFVVFILRAIIMFCAFYLGKWLYVHLECKLRCVAAERLLQWPAGQFKKIKQGDVIYKVIDVPNRICGSLVSFSTTILQSLAKVFGYLALLFYLDWNMTLFILLVLPLLAASLAWINKQIHKRTRGIIDASSHGVEYMTELLRMWPIIRTFGGEGVERQKQKSRFSRIRSLQLRREVAVSCGQPLTLLVFSLPIYFMVSYYINELQTGGITPGEVASYMSALVLLQVAARTLTKNINLWPDIVAHSRAFIEFINMPQEQDCASPPQGSLPVNGGISFKQVTFTYPGGVEPSLKEVDLEITTGETIALVGPSGAGKSTMVSLLLRLFDNDSGCIELFGKRLQDWPLLELRKQFAVVTQTPLLFNHSIAGNISYPQEPDGARVEAALAAVGMPEFVYRLPEGVDTHISSGLLSGGQQQLLSLARAFYKDAPVVVFDEPTSSLDSISEKAVKAGARHLLAGRTAIIIAHRFATIDLADRIAVVDGGKIVDYGKADQLFERCQLFRSMWREQQLGDRPDKTTP